MRKHIHKKFIFLDDAAIFHRLCKERCIPVGEYHDFIKRVLMLAEAQR